MANLSMTIFNGFRYGGTGIGLIKVRRIHNFVIYFKLQFVD